MHINEHYISWIIATDNKNFQKLTFQTYHFNHKYKYRRNIHILHSIFQPMLIHTLFLPASFFLSLYFSFFQILFCIVKGGSTPIIPLPVQIHHYDENAFNIIPYYTTVRIQNYILSVNGLLEGISLRIHMKKSQERKPTRRKNGCLILHGRGSKK